MFAFRNFLTTDSRETGGAMPKSSSNNDTQGEESYGGYNFFKTGNEDTFSLYTAQKHRTSLN